MNFETRLDVICASVVYPCFRKDLTLNEKDGRYYCSNHTFNCHKRECSRRFFDYNIDSDFEKGMICDQCPENIVYCSEHVPLCEICGLYKIDYCEKCTLDITKNLVSSACENCLDDIFRGEEPNFPIKPRK